MHSRALDSQHVDRLDGAAVGAISHGDSSFPARCRSASEAFQQQTTELQHQNPSATAFGAATAPSKCSMHHTSYDGQQQLRRPPARYSSNTSNLAGLSRTSPSSLPVHTRHRWPGKGHLTDETTCTCVLPRTSALCRLLVAMTVVLVFVQAVSCGMFFCVTLPMSHSRGSYVDYTELVSDLGTQSLSTANQQAAVQQVQQPPLAAVPKLIPRIIHQTYRNGRLPSSAKALMRTWAEVNGETWQVRFYSDDAALTFVRREFPEYFEAYLNLPLDLERAHFFRYMVVLRLGGAYADIDAECRQPLDSVIQPADTLLVGWDTEVANATTAAATGLARQRLIANWFFVAAAGHPVLRQLCDHIARNAMRTFSSNTARDTAERTGQGVWTDVVLEHALQHSAGKHEDPWKVRILPRVAFGVRPVGDDTALRPDTPGVIVLHHCASKWQAAQHRRLVQVLRPWLSWGRPSLAPDINVPVMSSNISHYPVSVSFSPPFTIMTDLVGLGDMQAAADVSAALTAHGTWQPGIAPFRRPAVVEALVGALEKHSQAHRSLSGTQSTATAAAQVSSAPQLADAAGATAGPAAAAAAAGPTAAGSVASDAGAAAAASARGVDAGAYVVGRPFVHDGSDGSASSSDVSPGGHQPAVSGSQPRDGVLIDIGAGHGFFSLAAAARGHRVAAFEASPASLRALQASITYNGFQDLVTVHPAALGSAPGPVCFQAADTPGCHAGVSAAVTRGTEFAAAPVSGELGTNSSGSRSRGRASTDPDQQQQQRLVALAEGRIRQLRGYPWLGDSTAALSADHSCCAVQGARLLLADVLSNTTDVAALRISAHGHEGFILEGALKYLQTIHQPDVIYVEFWPAAMQAAGYAEPVRVLQALYDVGYTDIAHAGRVCDERWQHATQGLQLQGGYHAGARMVLQQPTWCKLRPEQFAVLANATDIGAPENVMFLFRQSGRQHHSESITGSTASSHDGVGGRVPRRSSSSDLDSNLVSESSSGGRSGGSSRVPSSEMSTGPHSSQIEELKPVISGGEWQPAAASQQSQGAAGPSASLALPLTVQSSQGNTWQAQQPL